MPHADEAQLHAYLDREAEYADPNARKALGRHIADCSTCSALLKEVRQIHASSAKLLNVARPARRAMPSFDDVVRRANELRATASPATDDHVANAPAPATPSIEDSPPVRRSAESIAPESVTWIEPDQHEGDSDVSEVDAYDDETASDAPVIDASMYVADEIEAQESATDESDADIEFIEVSQPTETDEVSIEEVTEPTEDTVEGFESFAPNQVAPEENLDVDEFVDTSSEEPADQDEIVASAPAPAPADEPDQNSWDWLRRGSEDHLAAMQSDDEATTDQPGAESDHEPAAAEVDGLRISRDVGMEQDWMTSWTPAAPPTNDDVNDEIPDENEGAIEAPDLSLNHEFAAAEAEEEIEVPVARIPPVAPPPTAAQRRSSSAHRVTRRARRKRGTRVLALAATVVIAAGIGIWYGRPYINERFGVSLGGLSDRDTPAEPIAAAAEKSTDESPNRTPADARGAAVAEPARPARTQQARRSDESAANEGRALNSTTERDRSAQIAATPPPARPSAPPVVTTISGIVREVATNRPVPEAQVVVEGTGLTATTDPSGRYRLAAVPVGQSRIRTRAVGFDAETTLVALTGGRDATVDVALRPSSVALDQVAAGRASAAPAPAAAREERATDTGMSRRAAADLLGGPLVIVPGLPIVRIEESPAGGVRVTQQLQSGATLMLDIRQTGAYTPGSRIENFRVMANDAQETMASARFGSYLITARANVSSDELAALMRRLAESPDSD